MSFYLSLTAGVVLTTITGEDGIIQKAIHAKEERNPLEQISSIDEFYKSTRTINGEGGTGLSLKFIFCHKKYC